MTLKRKGDASSTSTSSVSKKAVSETKSPAIDIPTLGSDDDLEAGTVMCMKTLFTGQWRAMMEYIKDIAPIAPVSFTKDDGFRLKSMDPECLSMIDIQIKSEYYFLKDGKELQIKLDVESFCDKLRNLTVGGYLLELSMNENDMSHLKVVVSNEDKQLVITYKMVIPDSQSVKWNAKTTIYSKCFTMPAVDFQKCIRELDSISDTITLRSEGNAVILSATGVSGSSVYEIKPSTRGMTWKEKDNEPVECKFESKYLTRYSRPLSKAVEIFMHKDSALVLRYHLASAALRVYIMHLNDEDNEEEEEEENTDTGKK